ncbi:MAG: lytic transglycosylase domain-containing protein, partial [Eubacteriales bacterium]
MKNNKRSSFSLAVEITALILVFVIIIVGAGADSLKKGFDRSEYPRRYAKYVQSAAREFDIDENLIYAIIKAESKFDERALSSAGAMGLMQIMPETYEKDIKEKLGIESGADEALFDPEINIRCGAYYFSRWLDYFGDIETALAAYNAGFGNVRKWLSDERYSSDGKCIIPANIPFPET